jgi:hypothetical protein
VIWSELALIAAGAVRHDEISPYRSGRPATSFQPGFEIWAKRSVEAGSQLILELILSDGATRYEINADEFPFKYALNRPELSTMQKFIWLVREINHRAPGAILNRGARDMREGAELVRGYPSRQVFNDEMTWLLWNSAQTKRALT